MRDLIGQECCCDFDLPATEWPIPGYPAWVVVVDVDMPMVCLKSIHAGKPIWVNASKIKTITAVRLAREEPKPARLMPRVLKRPAGKWQLF